MHYQTITHWIVILSLLTGAVGIGGCSCAPDINRDGGFELTYELAEPSNIDESSVIDAVKLGLAGRRGVRVRLIDGNKLEVSVPGLKSTDLQSVQDLIATEGAFDFRVVADIQADSDLVNVYQESSDPLTVIELFDEDQLIGLWQSVKQTDSGENLCDFDSQVNLLRERDSQQEVLIKASAFDVNGSHLRSVSKGFDHAMRPAINFTLTTSGAKRMQSLTQASISRRLAIIIDGEVISAPTVQSEIRDRGQITGQLSEQDVDSLISVLRAGRLPYEVKDSPPEIREVSSGGGSEP